MADRWMDERERRWRDRDERRSDDYGRDDERRFEGGEDRSWGGSAEDDRGPYGRGRVFGERETGASYGGQNERRNPYGDYGGRGRVGARGESYGPSDYSGEVYDQDRGRRGAYSGQAERDDRRGEDARPEWQGRDFGGVSPAMRQDEYDAERRAERYQREHGYDEERRRFDERRGAGRGGPGYDEGGRFYGDAGRERIYREEWSQGRRDYGAEPPGYDAGLFDRGRDRGEEDRRRSFSGGTGGYDYERGYGDGGRERYEGRYGRDRDADRGRDDRSERWERGGREAGDWFRRTGERVAAWFGGDRGRDEERGFRRDEGRNRGFEGMGPKGYQRPDERINEEAHERLTDDPWLDASNISVSVSGGEVTLSGTVDNREAKHRAERMTEEISGVKHVQNNLRVEPGNPLTSPSRGYGDSVLQAQMREAETGSRSTGTSDGGTTARTTGSTSTDAGKSR